MKATTVLENLKDLGVSVWPEGDRLRYHGPKGVLSPDVLEQLKESKTDILTLLNPSEDSNQASNLSEFAQRKINQAAKLGLVARWSKEFGYISVHDPTTGEWHDLRTEDAPGWAKREALKRKELYKDGNYRAYDLTATEMEGIWEAERVPEPEGIIEDHPIEEEAG
jgi:hypothetical protein